MNPALPVTWYIVYILRSKFTGKIYIGCTGDFIKRLKEHNDGKVFSTKKILPVELFYFEGYLNKKLAYRREKMLKYFGSTFTKLASRIGLPKKGRAG